MYDAALSSLTAIDLFSGAGGTTQGLRDAGYDVLFAVENDASAARSFAANHPGVEILERDIRRVSAPALARSVARTGRRLSLLTACPPCQPFSTLGSGDALDPRNALVSSILRFVERLEPNAVLLENVPGVQREQRFVRLVAAISRSYEVRQFIVQASDFGVPQRRRRLIVLGVRRDLNASLPERLEDAIPESFDIEPQTAGDALALTGGVRPEIDLCHRARKSRETTRRRILAAVQGGGHRDLPPELQLVCHGKLKTVAATSIYGRIDPAAPAPTMTTRCTTPSCGRFVHPTEPRGLTLREAAVIQTFPLDYKFEGGYDSIERQIGNAVPPKLALALGLIVRRLLHA
jgi:DNA (cytosine-5)-methyltransferase 1